jgi:hypothetical protein
MSMTVRLTDGVVPMNTVDGEVAMVCSTEDGIVASAVVVLSLQFVLCL